MTGRFAVATSVRAVKPAAPAKKIACVALAAAVVSGCAQSVERPEATYVADERAEWRAGVNGQPLAPGESLLFDFGRPVTVTWNMRGVEYPLQLVALDLDGDQLGSWPMPVGMPELRPTVEARFWIELRE